MTKCLLCNKQAAFNYPTETPMYCSEHKQLGMLDVKNLKCVVCHGKIPKETRGNYCPDCYIFSK